MNISSLFKLSAFQSQLTCAEYISICCSYVIGFVEKSSIPEFPLSLVAVQAHNALFSRSHYGNRGKASLADYVIGAGGWAYFHVPGLRPLVAFSRVESLSSLFPLSTKSHSQVRGVLEKTSAIRLRVCSKMQPRCDSQVPVSTNRRRLQDFQSDDKHL